MKSQLRIALPVAATAVGILLAGCGSSGTTAQSSAELSAAASTPASTAASSSPATTTPASASPIASPSAHAAAASPAAAAAVAPPCRAAGLTIAYTDNSQVRHGALDGMSHADSIVTFTNKGTAACATAGFPGVAALNSAGRQIQQAARTPETAPVIVLHPGQTASALISGNTASCSKVTKVAGLLVTAPNQRTSTRLGSPGELCLHSLGVGTLKRGNSAGFKLG